MLHIHKVKPLFTNIITTADKFEEDYMQNSIIVAKAGDIKPWQTVIAIGSSVRDIQVGDQVMIKLENYVVRKYNPNSVQNDLDNNPTLRLQMNYVNIDDADGNPKECFLLSDRDILYSFEGEEVKEKAPKIAIQKPKLVLYN